MGWYAVENYAKNVKVQRNGWRRQTPAAADDAETNVERRHEGHQPDPGRLAEAEQIRDGWLKR